MSRPKPHILIESVNKKTFKSDQVLSSEGVWAIFYNGKPINLKTISLISSYTSPKYRKISFSNPGHAINLARKLNAQFKTDLFAVYKLTSGEPLITQDPNPNAPGQKI